MGKQGAHPRRCEPRSVPWRRPSAAFAGLSTVNCTLPISVAPAATTASRTVEILPRSRILTVKSCDTECPSKTRLLLPSLLWSYRYCGDKLRLVVCRSLSTRPTRFVAATMPATALLFSSNAVAALVGCLDSRDTRMMQRSGTTLISA